jgi:hypothetical protein
MQMSEPNNFSFNQLSPSETNGKTDKQNSLKKQVFSFLSFFRFGD